MGLFKTLVDKIMGYNPDVNPEVDTAVPIVEETSTNGTGPYRSRPITPATPAAENTRVCCIPPYIPQEFHVYHSSDGNKLILDYEKNPFTSEEHLTIVHPSAEARKMFYITLAEDMQAFYSILTEEKQMFYSALLDYETDNKNPPGNTAA
ncbi:hypothetical protein HQ545_01725 [Candidatus Woesearchaeota archaeon]|nr:hypothetical protein [Candidatus Woesearchaeota archaeon]